MGVAPQVETTTLIYWLLFRPHYTSLISRSIAKDFAFAVVTVTTRVGRNITVNLRAITPMRRMQPPA